MADAFAQASGITVEGLYSMIIGLLVGLEVAVLICKLSDMLRTLRNNESSANEFSVEVLKSVAALSAMLALIYFLTV